MNGAGDGLERLIRQLHRESMAAHEEYFGEAMTGCDFAIKCPMTAEELERLEMEVAPEW